jgi:hypothetical protein
VILSISGLIKNFNCRCCFACKASAGKGAHEMLISSILSTKLPAPSRARFARVAGLFNISDVVSLFYHRLLDHLSVICELSSICERLHHAGGIRISDSEAFSTVAVGSCRRRFLQRRGRRTDGAAIEMRAKRCSWQSNGRFYHKFHNAV